MEDSMELAESPTSSTETAATNNIATADLYSNKMGSSNTKIPGDHFVTPGSQKEALSADEPTIATPPTIPNFPPGIHLAGHGSTSGSALDVEQQPPVTTASHTPSIGRVPTISLPHMHLRDRLRHFTVAWFSLTLSTTSVALLLAITPHRFGGLNVIGLVLYFMDLAFFWLITVAIAVRFATHQYTFRRALTRPGEALFAPTFFLSIAAQLVSVREYGRLFWPDLATSTARQGLTRFLEVMFWIYLSATFAFSILQYHLLFVVQPARRLRLGAMSPAWIQPIFPVLLAGTLASVVSVDKGGSMTNSGLAIATAGLAAQGLGFFVAVFLYATYLLRLLTFGMPPGAQRPAMFIAVGPPSFTSAALIALATDIAPITSAGTNDSIFATIMGISSSDTTAVVALGASIRFVGLASGVFLWALSFWFLVMASVAVVIGGDRRFRLTWWSFVFPNVGFSIATIRFGTAFNSSGLLWFATMLTIVLVVVWLYIFIRCIWAVVHREILWPGHDEDA
jgi:tellurite resistance protein TehA-like permease